MYLALLADPFQSVQLPETVEEVLENGAVRCVAFNAWGTLLAGDHINLFFTIHDACNG